MTADKGNVDFMIKTAKLSYNGDVFIQVNKEEASKYYKMAADNGDIESALIYAKMMHRGDGIPVNIAEAFTYYTLIAGKGNVESMIEYANIVCIGEGGVTKDQKEAAKYYKMAADQGDVISMVNHKAEAARYFKLAADQGNAKAMISFADMINNKIEGVEMDRNKSKEYYKMASKKGDAESMLILANIIYFEENDERSKEEGHHYLKRMQNMVMSMQ